MRTTRLYPRTFPMRQHRGTEIILAILGILFLLGTVAAQWAQAQTLIVLHSFSGADGVDLPIAAISNPLSSAGGRP
jgi:hypothetical protein